MITPHDFSELMRHLAEEVNVKRVVINGVTVYDEPLLKDEYNDKQAHAKLDKASGPV